MTFEQFYANWYRFVRATARRSFNGSDEDREEIIQETFMIAWTQKTIPLDQMTATWLATVTQRQGYGRYKLTGGARLRPMSLDQERSRQAPGSSDEVWTLADVLAAPTVDFDPSAGDRLGARLSVRELDVVTRSADGYTDVEIGRALGVSASAIGGIKRYAAARLQGEEVDEHVS